MILCHQLADYQGFGVKRELPRAYIASGSTVASHVATLIAELAFDSHGVSAQVMGPRMPNDLNHIFTFLILLRVLPF